LIWDIPFAFLPRGRAGRREGKPLSLFHQIINFHIHGEPEVEAAAKAVLSFLLLFSPLRNPTNDDCMDKEGEILLFFLRGKPA